MPDMPEGPDFNSTPPKKKAGLSGEDLFKKMMPWKYGLPDNEDEPEETSDKEKPETRAETMRIAKEIAEKLNELWQSLEDSLTSDDMKATYRERFKLFFYEVTFPWNPDAEIERPLTLFSNAGRFLNETSFIDAFVNNLQNQNKARKTLADIRKLTSEGIRINL